MRHENQNQPRDDHEYLIEEIIDELLHGDPDRALRRLEGAGLELEDLLL